MNRIIISTSCLLIVVILSFSSLKKIDKITTPIINQLEIAKTYALNSNFDEVYDIVEYSKRAWDKDCSFLGMILALNKLDQIDENFVRIIEHAKNGDNPSFQIESSELIHRLEDLFFREQLNAKNIF